MSLEEIKVPNEQQEEDPKHIEEMVEKAEGGIKTKEQSLLAGKYKTEEDLQKGVLEILKFKNEGKTLEEIYKLLESDKPADNTSEDRKDETPPTDKGKEDEDNQQFDYNAFEQELVEQGGLSEESYSKLEAQGVPKQLIDGYIEGMKALGEKQAQEFYTIVGGQEQYDNMIEWAKVNLKESEKKVFNESIATGNIDTAKFATEALHARYVKAKGNPPNKLLQGDTPSTTPVDAYKSIAQLTQDMNDPRYQKDPAFRKKVQDKISKSNIF